MWEDTLAYFSFMKTMSLLQFYEIIRNIINEFLNYVLKFYILQQFSK